MKWNQMQGDFRGSFAAALCLWVWSAGGCLWGAQALAGTQPLTRTEDLAAAMVEGIHAYLDRETERQAGSARLADLPAEQKRERLSRYLGVVDARVAAPRLRLNAELTKDATVAAGSRFRVLSVTLDVLESMTAEGLLLQPHGRAKAFVIALPEADWTAEHVAGLIEGKPASERYAQRLAENGLLVFVPTLVDRADTYSGRKEVRLTNQPHREFIYRMAYEMGRHILGYEVQKVLAAVDWAERQYPGLAAAVAGYGEGGLVALLSAALDTRLKACLVAGAFRDRRQMWREPIYRNVWRYLAEFGDAETAALIAPRPLIVASAEGPLVAGPPPETATRRGAAQGALVPITVQEEEREAERARRYFARAGAERNFIYLGSSARRQAGLAEESLKALSAALGWARWDAARPLAMLRPLRQEDAAARQERQFRQMVAFTQRLVRRSEAERDAWWRKAQPARDPAAWERAAEPYRDYFWREVLGKLPEPEESLQAFTRRIYERQAWTGYEVLLPVWRDVFAYGILLVPAGIQPGERRAVVVCQHGLEGRPQHLIEPETDRQRETYREYAARLAEKGYVVYAPQNPYLGEDRFRQILRKSHPLGYTLFSFIVGQHQRTLEWLATLPFVDGRRIAFYGLSYGGKTAMRVPPLVTGYRLSICSADFNEWIRKITDVDHAFSYMYTREYDMLEFNLGATFNYAEMARLIAPRPFMVERGHRDGVGIDEWVAYEYAKVRRFYADLGIPEKTEIEFFDGPHRINAQGTFAFLEKHLGPPGAGGDRAAGASRGVAKTDAGPGSVQ